MSYIKSTDSFRFFGSQAFKSSRTIVGSAFETDEVALLLLKLESFPLLSYFVIPFLGCFILFIDNLVASIGFQSK